MKITFIGGGNMAVAMIGGLIKQGFLASEICVVEPEVLQRRWLKQHFSVLAIPTYELLPPSEVFIFAIKPQQFKAVAESIVPYLRQALVISIAAGIRIEAIVRWLGGHHRVIRVMPNIPAQLQAGISGIFAHTSVSAQDRENAEHLLAAIGELVWVDDEHKMDNITAITGSGPAYVFYFMEALQAAACAQGFEPEIAKRLAYQTFSGAVALALASEDDVATLRQKVTSPGGTTDCAIKLFENKQLGSTIIEAAAAAAIRSRELSETLGS